MKAKKLTSIFLIVAIVLTLGISAMAADVTNTGTITINAPTGESLQGRTFEGYLLFEVTEVDDVIDPTQYNYKPTPLLKAAVDSITGTSYATDEAYVNYVDNLNDVDLENFANAVKATLNNAITPYTINATLVADDPYTYATVTNVPYGYYIIIEATTSLPLGATPMLFALDTTKIDIQIKADFEKVVKTHGDGVDLSYAVGDPVEYSLSAEYPFIYPGGTTTIATHIFIDEPKAGLVLKPNTIALSIGGEAIDLAAAETAGSVRITENTPVGGFTLYVDYIKLGGSYTAGDEVLVTYTTTITSDAVTLNDLTNDVTLTYDRGGSTNGTVKNDFTVYTYGFEFTKVNSLDDGLLGAEFELTKASDATKTPMQFTVKTVGSTTYYVYDPLATSGTTTTLVSGSDGKVNIYGLDEGTYTLTETQPPSGYNLLGQTISIKIDAVLDTDGNHTKDCAVSYAYGDSTSYTDITTDNALSILNVTGIELPSTGGIGTIMFGIFGCLIIVGGATGITMLIIKLKRRYSVSR